MVEGKTLKVALVDRRALVREGLKHLLDDPTLQVVASVERFSDLVGPLEKDGLHVDVVLFDFERETDVEHEAMERLRQFRPTLRVVALSDNLCVERLIASFRTELDGFLLKDISAPALRQSIELVMLGQKVFPTSLLKWIATHVPSYVYEDNAHSAPANGLSGREVKILQHLVRGHPNKVIANSLKITEGTVKIHLKTILKKINAHNRTQAAIWALHNGMDRQADNAGQAPLQEPQVRGNGHLHPSGGPPTMPRVAKG